MSNKRHAYSGGTTARYVFAGATVALTLFGLVMIYSASSITAAAREGSSEYFFLRQLLFVAVFGGLAVFIGRFDYRLLKERVFALWAGGVGLLLLTLVIGVARGGARRWIPLGITQIQPSELAKIACVLIVATVAVDWMRGSVDTRTFLIRVATFTGIPAFLVVVQPDLGTTLTLVAAVGIVLFLAGIPWRWLFITIGFGVALAVVGIMAEPYRLRRIAAFTDPFADPLGKGYQTVQALLAFGTGGVGGVGLGLSRQKFFYLPEAHTDFILAIIGEEVGLIGTLGVIVGFAVFLWAGFKIAMGAKDPFGRLVAGGLTGMLGLQAVLNMSAVTGLIPVTGKPLPLLSYGGSSMLVTMICVGLILSVSEYGALAPRALRRRPAPERADSSKERGRASTDQRGRNGGPRLSRVDGGRRTRRGA